CSASRSRVASPATTASNAKRGVASSTKAAGAGACTLPLTQDPYDGFHIGVPVGWNLFTRGGTIVVSKDPTGTEEATVTPVLITNGLTPTAAFSSSMSALQKDIAASGGTMTDTVTSSGDQLPAASLSLESGQVSMVGQARVVLLPELTAHGSSVVALLSGWSPASSFAGGRGSL